MHCERTFRLSESLRLFVVIALGNGKLHSMDSRKKIGRPRCPEERRVVYFAESTFRMWNEKKKELSPDKNHLITSNDFAIFLLNQLGQENFVRNDRDKQTVKEDHQYIVQDTRRVKIHSPVDVEAEISTTPIKLKSTDGR